MRLQKCSDWKVCPRSLLRTHALTHSRTHLLNTPILFPDCLQPVCGVRVAALIETLKQLRTAVVAADEQNTATMSGLLDAKAAVDSELYDGAATLSREQSVCVCMWRPLV